jgi:hypothetical protein
MVPVAFDEENAILDVPAQLASQYEPLPIYFSPAEGNHLPMIVSCWKITKEELEEIQRTGRIWVVAVGNTMQPLKLMGDNPFEEIAGK